MKKFGIVIFIVAILIGVVFSNLFSFGKASGKIFSFSLGSKIKGSGVSATEKREVAEFHGIDVGGVFEVEITAGKDFDVQIEADDNLLQYIRTEVDNGYLKVSTTEQIKSRNGLKVRIAAPNIDHIDASGASSVTLSGAKTSELGIDTSGASKLNLSGETASLSIKVSGASQIDAEGLKAENANVDASGASKVSLFVTNRLVSEASGASKIGYLGNPTSVEKSASGASKVYER